MFTENSDSQRTFKRQNTIFANRETHSARPPTFGIASLTHSGWKTRTLKCRSLQLYPTPRQIGSFFSTKLKRRLLGQELVKISKYPSSPKQNTAIMLSAVFVLSSLILQNEGQKREQTYHSSCKFSYGTH